jgi:hypothetical protein
MDDKRIRAWTVDTLVGMRLSVEHNHANLLAAARTLLSEAIAETWAEATKAQREADMNVCDSLIPGSYKKNIQHRPLVPLSARKSESE